VSDRTSTAELRRRILGARGVKPAKYTKRMLTTDQQPDDYPKTPKMKMLEYKYHIKLESILFKGSLLDVCRMLHYEVDRSTISRWRNYVTKELGRVYYE